MGFVYQGWFARCDGCGGEDKSAILGRTKPEVISDIKKDGWVIRGQKLLCDICIEQPKPPAGETEEA